MKLEDIDKTKNPFKVPDGYFDNFESNIMDNIHDKEKSKKQKVLHFNYFKRFASIAALVILSLFIFSPENTYKDYVNDTEIVNNLSDINTEELMYLFSASELEDYIVSEMYTELK